MKNLNPDKVPKAFPECREYAELRSQLKTLPATWYPDLIRALVEEAIKRRVFVAGGATRFVAQIEERNPHG